LRKTGGADLVAADKLAALFGLCFFRCYIDAGEAFLFGEVRRNWSRATLSFFLKKNEDKSFALFN
jgi:hypothetical protein